MESDSSLLSGGNTPELPPPALAPARNVDQSREEERVSSSDLMVKEGNFVGVDQNKKVEMSKLLDQIHEKASSVLKFSIEWEELEKRYNTMDNLLEERAMEVELKEKSVTERIVELEKKEERLKEVEERERKICLLEKSMTLRLEEKEKENDLRLYLESSLMRFVLEKVSEEVRNNLEERGKEVERVFKLNDEKSCELEKAMSEFDLKQKVASERRSNDAEMVKECLMQLEAREKEIRLLEEAIKELVEAEKKEEAEQKAKAEEMELKRKSLEEKEKELEEREKELDLKEKEVEERLIQAETCKRSRMDLLAEMSSESDSLDRPAKKLKSHNHGDANKEQALVCVVSDCSSSFDQTSEESDEETDEDPEQLSCVDSEFYDFKNTMSSFVAGTVWALYDPIDDMPRLYAKIKRIHESSASLEVTWLESIDEESVPVACGRYKYGKTQTMNGHLAFSHEMQPIIHEHDKKFITVNPMKGETWALFRDWSNNNTKQHKPPFRYDFVEVVLDFDDNLGVGVTYLGKVQGFVSVFEHALQHGIYSLMIPPEEMTRFSHRVPSVIMNGEEREGVPAGSFELDPAAIPISMLKLDHSDRELAVTSESGEAGEVEDTKAITVIILD